MFESRIKDRKKEINKSALATSDENHKKRWKIMQNRTIPVVFRHIFSAT